MEHFPAQSPRVGVFRESPGSDIIQSGFLKKLKVKHYNGYSIRILTDGEKTWQAVCKFTYSRLIGFEALLIDRMIYYRIWSYFLISLYQKISRSLFSKSCCFHAGII